MLRSELQPAGEELSSGLGSAKSSKTDFNYPYSIVKKSSCLGEDGQTFDDLMINKWYV